MGIKKIHLVNAPIMQLSSIFIRKAIKEGKNILDFLSKPVIKEELFATLNKWIN